MKLATLKENLNSIKLMLKLRCKWMTYDAWLCNGFNPLHQSKMAMECTHAHCVNAYANENGKQPIAKWRAFSNLMSAVRVFDARIYSRILFISMTKSLLCQRVASGTPWKGAKEARILLNLHIWTPGTCGKENSRSLHLWAISDWIS